jgi:hypothetical protein
MAAGRYRVLDGNGWAGWRYASDIETTDPTPHREVVDLVVDQAWRPVRTRIDTGAHEIIVQVDGLERLTGLLDGERIELPWGPDVHLDYLSPAYNAVTANRLRTTAEIDVVYLDAYTCEPRMERQRYEDLGSRDVETPVGRFPARAWRYTALSSGWSRTLDVAGDVVVAYDGLFSLESYDAGASGPRPVPPA